MNLQPGSVQHVSSQDGSNEINKRMEFIPPNPKVRQDYEDTIRVLVSILNANNVHLETINMANEKIRQITNVYYNPVLTIKEI